MEFYVPALLFYKNYDNRELYTFLKMFANIKAWGKKGYIEYDSL